MVLHYDGQVEERITDACVFPVDQHQPFAFQYILADQIIVAQGWSH